MKTQCNNIYTQIEQTTHNLPSRNVLYDFFQAYNKYMNIGHHFADEGDLTSMEAHLLKHICQNPGITITDIAKYWSRTKGTISSQISRLEKNGYIYRVVDSQNLKIYHISPTEKGLRANDNHTAFDIAETTDFLNVWLKKYSEEEINDFYDKLVLYKDFLLSKIK